MPLPNSAAIRAIRKAKGLKGVDLARALGVSHGHLFNLESDRRVKHASEDLLTRLAEALDVPVAAVTIPETIEPTRRRRSTVKQAA